MDKSEANEGWRYNLLRLVRRRTDKKILILPVVVILIFIMYVQQLTTVKLHRVAFISQVKSYSNPRSQFPDYLLPPRRLPCVQRSTQFQISQHGQHWALQNLAAATKRFRCDESVTFAVHANEHDDLSILEEVVKRWAGPVSLSLHATRLDFAPVIAAIRYSRSCLSPLVQQLVSFHVFFSTWNVPDVAPGPFLHREPYNCSLPPPWSSYSLLKGGGPSFYPPSEYNAMNVGRNIAIEAAATHYILAAELNMLPSKGLVKDFLEYVQKNTTPLNNRVVFAMPVFRLGKNVPVPENKAELNELWKRRNAYPFWALDCSTCDLVPKLDKWAESKGSGVFHVAKRINKDAVWEPFYIGTRDDPQQDERYEVRGDKSLQKELREQKFSFRM